MKKFLIFRAYADIVDEDDPLSTAEQKEGSELVAVEYGESVYEAAGAIHEAICADLSELPEGKGCEVGCKLVENGTNWPNIEYIGIIMPPNADTNILKLYTIVEKSADGDEL